MGSPRLSAGPRHRLAAARDVSARALEREAWSLGPGGIEPASPSGRFFARQRIAPADVRAFPSEAAALTAAAAGEGLALAVAHTVFEEVRRRTLARLDVRGAPFDDLWHVSALSADRCPPAALALRRFVASREAVKAMLFRRGGVPAARVRPALHSTLWSSLRA